MSSASATAFEPTRGDPPKGHEPSMEEILASIRRIISDDQGTAPAPQAEPSLAAATSDDDDVLDLANADRVAPAPDAIGDDEIAFRDALPEAAAAVAEESPVAEPGVPEHAVGEEEAPVLTEPLDRASQEAQPEPDPPEEISRPAEDQTPGPPPAAAPVRAAIEERLLSPATDVTVSSAFNSLATTILSNNARTLEDLVRELLKPMLKTWLDDNLPVLVERLVKAEIERVARGGRS